MKLKTLPGELFMELARLLELSSNYLCHKMEFFSIVLALVLLIDEDLVLVGRFDLELEDLFITR